jgi:tRNA A37 threonylcarbamoyladenosine dehydratase
VELLVGARALGRLATARVILFGAGGVGSFCAEALIRSGLGHLTLVDPDRVAESNLNRQAQALTTTIGELKAEALRVRLLAIRPEAEVLVLPRLYNLESRDSFELTSYDYVLDAIDSLSNKVGLIQHASELGCRVFTSMGASQKLDPSRVKVGSIWKSERDPLARFVRKRLRRRGFHGEVTCVYSDEAPRELQPSARLRPDSPLGPEEPGQDEEAAEDLSACARPVFGRQVNGSLMQVTATFGLFLASLVVNDLVGE